MAPPSTGGRITTYQALRAEPALLDLLPRR
jgi:hypothetical protein